MEIVVDTSVVLAVLLKEPEKVKLLEITRDCNLLAPQSLFWEIGNALSAMFKRNRITLKESSAIIKCFDQIPIKYCEINVLKSLEIAYELKIYAYDAYMIECARNYRVPLLTLDVMLKEKARLKKIPILEIQ
ncbi:MAG TPA: type II toxin-antitoxin system VapC family toxin [Chitinispirillaceae bacterium]|nr:type II toxin-antitoxin system VapC family toxin [Chitinispirillaceae bacterium]